MLTTMARKVPAATTTKIAPTARNEIRAAIGQAVSWLQRWPLAVAGGRALFAWFTDLLPFRFSVRPVRSLTLGREEAVTNNVVRYHILR
jgi:hypothetical protein